MDEVLIEIPEEQCWQPPVLREGTTEKPESQSSPADVFFMQYAVCIIMVTVLLLLRLLDQSAYLTVAGTFREHCAAPAPAWTEMLFQS